MSERPKSEIKCLSMDELRAELAAMGEKPFRAKQIFKWLHTPVPGSRRDLN